MSEQLEGKQRVRMLFPLGGEWRPCLLSAWLTATNEQSGKTYLYPDLLPFRKGWNVDTDFPELLKFSTEVAHILLRAGLRSKREVAVTPDHVLLMLCGLGKPSLKIIRDVIPFEGVDLPVVLETYPKKIRYPKATTGKPE